MSNIVQKVKSIWIPGDVRSSKNSKMMVMKEGRKPLLLHSKTVTKYIKQTKLDWLEQKDAFKYLVRDLKYPYIIYFHFVRGSKRRWDGANLLQLPLDLMVKYGYLEDDSMNHIIPHFIKHKGNWFSYDKQNPGLWITVHTKELEETIKQERIKLWQQEELNTKKEIL